MSKWYVNDFDILKYEDEVDSKNIDENDEDERGNLNRRINRLKIEGKKIWKGRWKITKKKKRRKRNLELWKYFVGFMGLSYIVI